MSKELAKMMSEMFSSGNGIPVERITITRAEYLEVLDESEHKQECETCSAKRKRLTEAGLLKSPLREGLATPEPLAYVDPKTIEWFLSAERTDRAFSAPTLTKTPSGFCNVALYTSQPRKEWVDLTSTQIDALIYNANGMRASLIYETIRKLKELND